MRVVSGRSQLVRSKNLCCMCVCGEKVDHKDEGKGGQKERGEGGGTRQLPGTKEDRRLRGINEGQGLLLGTKMPPPQIAPSVLRPPLSTLYTLWPTPTSSPSAAHQQHRAAQVFSNPAGAVAAALPILHPPSTVHRHSVPEARTPCGVGPQQLHP